MHVTEKQLKMIAEVASQKAVETVRALEVKEKKARRDRRLRNIKLLLKNYRSFKKHCEDIKLDIDEINERIEFVTMDSEEFRLESIKRSKEKTLIMVRYTEKMMTVYRIMCEQSDDEEAMRLYKTIDSLYISDVKKTAEEVARGHSVHKRTVYKDVDKACETLVVLMFGIDGVRFL